MSVFRNPTGSPVGRLSAMMFLQFFVLGSTMPLMSLYLKSRLGFTGVQTGYILAGSALSAIVSPFIGALIADRIISAERLLSITHAAGAILLYILSTQSAFLSVFTCHLFYWLLIGPTVALTTAITFHHAPHAVKTFGGIRLWGTLGWIAAAWVYRLVFTRQGLEQTLHLGAYASMFLSIFALSLPPGARQLNRPVVLLPREALEVILKRPVLIFCIFAVLISIADRMYMYGGAPYLKSLGYHENNLMPMLSIGQLPEILGLFLLGMLITRFGTKSVLLLGASLEVIRFLLFALGAKGTWLCCGISLHGLTYAFFFVTASIFLDGNCDRATRSGVHQYFGLFVGGISTFAGNLLAGFVAQQTTSSATGGIMFGYFWIVPLLISFAGLAGIFFFFKPDTPPPTIIR